MLVSISGIIINYELSRLVGLQIRSERAAGILVLGSFGCRCSFLAHVGIQATKLKKEIEIAYKHFIIRRPTLKQFLTDFFQMKLGCAPISLKITTNPNQFRNAKLLRY